MVDIVIPPEVTDAVWEALANGATAENIVTAALSAWPGMEIQQITGRNAALDEILVSRIILPLPQEAGDDR